jgi:tubulin-specific chaperone E
MSQKYPHGTRLSISSFLCTVLYEGPVKGTPGTWLGVEWDDPSRGKHSGEHNGTQYFSTRFIPVLDTGIDYRIPCAGSFIRPDRKTDGERTFLDALKEKYASHHEYEQIFLEDSGKEIEMIGFDKIEAQQRWACRTRFLIPSNLRELAVVVLDSMMIRWSNPFDEIRNICPRIGSLDLSRNLFSTLSEVARICRPLTELRTLRLTGNRFSDISLSEELHDAFNRIQWLALNMCGLSWEEVYALIGS